MESSSIYLTVLSLAIEANRRIEQTHNRITTHNGMLEKHLLCYYLIFLSLILQFYYFKFTNKLTMILNIKLLLL